MVPSDGLDQLLKHVLDLLGMDQAKPGEGTSPAAANGCNGNAGKPRPTVDITPQKLAVLAGLLTNVLEIKSFLVDRNQVIEIVLDGSLKRKTPADKMLDQVGPMPFDQVMRAISDRYS